MATTVLMTAIGATAVAFLMCFFIALCKERRGGACHIVHVVRHWDAEEDAVESDPTQLTAHGVLRVNLTPRKQTISSPSKARAAVRVSVGER